MSGSDASSRSSSFSALNPGTRSFIARILGHRFSIKRRSNTSAGVAGATFAQSEFRHGELGGLPRAAYVEVSSAGRRRGRRDGPASQLVSADIGRSPMSEHDQVEDAS
jgi:hypothetical protein